MAWRIHLSNQTIQRLHILREQLPVLAVATREPRIHFYHFETGVFVADVAFPPNIDFYDEALPIMMGPRQEVFLPVVRNGLLEVHFSHDGTKRLIRESADRFIFITTDGQRLLPLRAASTFVAVVMARETGTIAALDEHARLHLFEDGELMGTFPTRLEWTASARPAVKIADDGRLIVVSNGRLVTILNSEGRMIEQAQMHYFIGQLSCSPNGRTLLTSDLESGVLRVYQADRLLLTHQRFAIDLLTDANRLQLMTDSPPEHTAISALVAGPRGALAFALGGVVCVTDVQKLVPVPRPQPFR